MSSAEAGLPDAAAKKEVLAAFSEFETKGEIKFDAVALEKLLLLLDAKFTAKQIRTVVKAFKKRVGGSNGNGALDTAQFLDWLFSDDMASAAAEEEAPPKTAPPQAPPKPPAETQARAETAPAMAKAVLSETRPDSPAPTGMSWQYSVEERWIPFSKMYQGGQVQNEIEQAFQRGERAPFVFPAFYLKDLQIPGKMSIVSTPIFFNSEPRKLRRVMNGVENYDHDYP
mmetsp:Transcript_28894/g.52815  ORF Transcript_28894/g.52815 Transcript_28894/m.52815 type:complete len:227 (+) Transcript_28894:44-724(+)